MLTLHDSLHSGNGYKVRLLLRMTGVPFRRVEYDLDAGETRTPAFLALNPNGRVPTVEFEDGRTLWESGAILVRFAEGTPFLPADPDARADVLQWLFFEQYSHEPYVAVVRNWVQHGLPPGDHKPAELAERREKGRAALQVLEDRLAGRDWLAGDGPTIADIALYAYTHVAPEGDIPLEPYPAVRAWCARFAALPGYVPITHDGGWDSPPAAGAPAEAVGA